MVARCAVDGVQSDPLARLDVLREHLIGVRVDEVRDRNREPVVIEDAVHRLVDRARYVRLSVELAFAVEDRDRRAVEDRGRRPLVAAVLGPHAIRPSHEHVRGAAVLDLLAGVQDGVVLNLRAERVLRHRAKEFAHLAEDAIHPRIDARHRAGGPACDGLSAREAAQRGKADAQETSIGHSVLLHPAAFPVLEACAAGPDGAAADATSLARSCHGASDPYHRSRIRRHGRMKSK